MEEFRDAFQRRMGKKRLSGQALGALAIHLVKEKMTYPDKVSGYVKNRILFVSVSDQEDIPYWFMRRAELLEEINTHLQQYASDVSFTQIRISGTGVSSQERYDER